MVSKLYNTEKQKMLKSVYLNGGFYIGRYEAGCDNERTQKTNDEDLVTPIKVKPDISPYIYVTRDQSKKLSQEMYSNRNFSTDLIAFRSYLSNVSESSISAVISFTNFSL